MRSGAFDAFAREHGALGVDVDVALETLARVVGVAENLALREADHRGKEVLHEFIREELDGVVVPVDCFLKKKKWDCRPSRKIVNWYLVS